MAYPMSGNFAPISFEADADNLPIKGSLPRELCGTLFRNGPNPQLLSDDPRQHWFMGDGMIHGFRLHEGRASYANRWVRTQKWRQEHETHQPSGIGFGSNVASDGVANTNIVWHGGRLLALEEAHLPIEIDPATLSTRGVYDAGGALRGPVTAHPKIDPQTGELIFFGYSARGSLSPTMSYGVLAAAGNVARFEQFEAPYCSMVHDFAVTASHVIFPILPLTGDLARARSGRPPFAWEPEKGACIGVIRRDEGAASLIWFRAPTCYVFHVMNAWEEGHLLFVDVMQYDEAPLFPHADGSTPREAPATLVRWRLDLAGNGDMIHVEPLDDLGGEFPRFDERRSGLAYRHGYFAGRRVAASEGFDTIVHLDLPSGRRRLLALPEGDATSEPVFVPRGEAEGDGWLLAVIWRAAERRSDLIVLDATAIDDGPVATVELSHRVPFGFHGNWMPAV